MVFADISSVMQLTTIKLLNEYKDHLLATVSHNLRTPLNGVIANLEIAYQNETCKDNKNVIKYAKVASFLLLNAINDLLDYSQIGLGKLRILKK
jgi:signal transduction histidine kinase